MIRGSISLACATLLIASAPTFAVVLYDGSLGTTPNAQGWLAYGDADLFNDYASTGGGQTRKPPLAASRTKTV